MVGNEEDHMLTQFSRTELLLGKEGMERLKNARVAVFGVGGVGGYVCEALVRSGVGSFDLVDDDKVCLTNLNRQIISRQIQGRCDERAYAGHQPRCTSGDLQVLLFAGKCR